MADVLGDPGVDVRLNDSLGPGGVLTVTDAATGDLFLRVETGGTHPGDVLITRDLYFFPTSPKRIYTAGGSLTLEGSPLRLGNGIGFVEIRTDIGVDEVTAFTGSKLGLMGQELRLVASGDGQSGGTLVRVLDDSSGTRLERFAIARGTSGEVILEASATSTPSSLRLVPSAGLPVVLDGPTQVTGDLEVSAGGVSVASGDVAVASGDVRVSGPTAQVVLESTGPDGIRYAMQSTAAGEFKIIHDDGTPVDLFTFTRSTDSAGDYVNEIRGPASGGSPKEIVSIVAEAQLALQADDAVVLRRSTGDAGLTLFADPDPEAYLYAGNPASGTAGLVSLGLTGNGAIRFGTYTGGGASFPTFNDRLRIDHRGTLTVYAGTSVGSPGTQPVMDMDSRTLNEAVLTVGSPVAAKRGQVVAAYDGTNQPGLIVLEADDGTPLYLSAWWDSGNARYSLRGSLAVPSSVASGRQIAWVS